MGKRTESNYFFIVVIFLINIFQTIGRLTYRPFLYFFQNSYTAIKKIDKFFTKLPAKLPKIPKIHIKITLPQIKKLLKKRRPRIKKPKKTKPKWLKKIAVLLTALAVLSLIIVTFYYWILQDLPKPDKLSTYQPPLTTKLYDRNGRLLYKIFRDQNRTLIPLDKIPQSLINATVAIEDKNFFQHNGFSIEGFSRALKRNIFNQQVEGGSTITQQLIKNTLLTPEKTIQRKLKELILSFQVELIFDKQEILTMYLNTVPYGGTSYGVEEASQTYFGKSVQELNLAESAFLAGLPAAPSKYSPFGPNPELSVIRQHEVLRRMVEDGYITPFEAEITKSSKIFLVPLKNEIQAPHFVMYLKDYLAEKTGLITVEQGGLTVVSSLDLNIQQMAEKAVNDELAKLANMNVTNGAALIVRPETGEILAMVGSKNYFDQSIDGNVNVTLQPRQPGSTIKVINYANALTNSYTAASIISDTPISYRIPGQAPYQPINYDNRFHGQVTLRQALANSYNVPAVKVLASFGVEKMVQQAKQMGITTWNDSSRFGLSLTLGGGEVKMIDMATTYGVLANYGYKVKPNPILSVKDPDKKSIFKNSCFEGLVQNPFLCLAKEAESENTCQKQKVLDSGVAFILSDILADNKARTPAFGANSLLNIKGHQVAVKTGTTNNKRDNWCIGYTRDYLVLVWVGNNNNEPMSAVASGITGATPIWHTIMTELLANEPAHIFTVPENITKLQICTYNGLLACPGCANQTEYFIRGTEPKQACNSEEIKIIQAQKAKDMKNKILEGLSTAN